MSLNGTLAAIDRYPVKGLTAQALTRAHLIAGEGMHLDRAYAVENGPSGFDATAPAHISKMKFVALAPIPAAARLDCRFDETRAMLAVRADTGEEISVDLEQAAGRESLAAFLHGALQDEARGDFKVVSAPRHHFFDDDRGEISLINLATVRALAERMGVTLDPRRFRGNLMVEGWEAFAEFDLAPGTELRLGDVAARVFKPIRRCVATHVNLATGLRDLDVVGALQSFLGHANCGLYLSVTAGGEVALGDSIRTA